MIRSVAFPLTVGVDVIIRIGFPVLNAANFANSSAGASRLASAMGGQVKSLAARTGMPMIFSVTFPSVVIVDMYTRSRNLSSVRYLLSAAKAISVSGISGSIASRRDVVSYFGSSVVIIGIKVSVLNSANFTNCSGMTVSHSSAMRG